MRESRLSASQLADLDATAYCEIPNHYDDGQPYRIGRKLLEEGDRHLLLGAEIKIDVPVRLIHGQADADVPWQLSVQLADLVLNEDVELLLVKQGDHRLSEAVDLERLEDVLSRLWAQLHDG